MNLSAPKVEGKYIKFSLHIEKYLFLNKYIINTCTFHLLYVIIRKLFFISLSQLLSVPCFLILNSVYYFSIYSPLINLFFLFSFPIWWRRVTLLQLTLSRGRPHYTVEILVDLSCLLSLLYSAISLFDTLDLLCNFLLLKRVLFDVLVFFYLCCVSFLFFLTQLLYFLIILLIILCFSSVATNQ